MRECKHSWGRWTQYECEGENTETTSRYVGEKHETIVLQERAETRQRRRCVTCGFMEDALVCEREPRGKGLK